jgi:COX assembly mitochondrial protein 1
MAAMAAQAPPAGPPAQDPLSVPSRNPLPLSASQEAQVRDIYYARVRKACSAEIKGSPRPLPSFATPSSPN